MNILPIEILNKIFDNLDKIKDKNNLSIITKEFYNYYGGENIKKFKIQIYLNNNYIKFYEFLNKYKYNDNYLNWLAKKSINDIPSIYGSRSCGYYDMRYIFELMYYGIILEDNFVEKLNKNFYLFFLKI